jgi:hypothetical protein
VDSIAALGPAQRWPSSVRWCLPLCHLIGGGLLLRFDTCEPAGGSCSCFLSPVSALCVVPGRVDDPIQPASKFL